jgi:hypothetical protein
MTHLESTIFLSVGLSPYPKYSYAEEHLFQPRSHNTIRRHEVRLLLVDIIWVPHRLRDLDFFENLIIRVHYRIIEIRYWNIDIGS